MASKGAFYSALALHPSSALLQGYIGNTPVSLRPDFVHVQMATPDTAMALLEVLRNASFATAQKELEELRIFAASKVSPCAVPRMQVAAALC